LVLKPVPRFNRTYVLLKDIIFRNPFQTNPTRNFPSIAAASGLGSRFRCRFDYSIVPAIPVFPNLLSAISGQIPFATNQNLYLTAYPYPVAHPSFSTIRPCPATLPSIRGMIPSLKSIAALLRGITPTSWGVIPLLDGAVPDAMGVIPLQWGTVPPKLGATPHPCSVTSQTRGTVPHPLTSSAVPAGLIPQRFSTVVKKYRKRNSSRAASASFGNDAPAFSALYHYLTQYLKIGVSIFNSLSSTINGY
jgi:hypothetical protein